MEWRRAHADRGELQQTATKLGMHGWPNSWASMSSSDLRMVLGSYHEFSLQSPMYMGSWGALVRVLSPATLLSCDGRVCSRASASVTLSLLPNLSQRASAACGARLGRASTSPGRNIPVWSRSPPERCLHLPPGSEQTGRRHSLHRGSGVEAPVGMKASHRQKRMRGIRPSLPVQQAGSMRTPEGGVRAGGGGEGISTMEQTLRSQSGSGLRTSGSPSSPDCVCHLEPGRLDAITPSRKDPVSKHQ